MADIMVFRAGGREYQGKSALEIVEAIRREAAGGGDDRRHLSNQNGSARDHSPSAAARSSQSG